MQAPATLEPQALAPVVRNQQGRWSRPDPLLDVPQSRIVELTGLDKSVLSRILSGQRAVRLDEAVAISDAIGVPLETLNDVLTARRKAQAQTQTQAAA